MNIVLHNMCIVYMHLFFCICVEREIEMDIALIVRFWDNNANAWKTWRCGPYSSQKKSKKVGII